MEFNSPAESVLTKLTLTASTLRGGLNASLRLRAQSIANLRCGYRGAVSWRADREPFRLAGDIVASNQSGEGLSFRMCVALILHFPVFILRRWHRQIDEFTENVSATLMEILPLAYSRRVHGMDVPLVARKLHCSLLLWQRH